MTDYPQLARPPLREALIDFQISEELSLSFAENLKDGILPGFEPVHPIKQGMFSFQIGATKPAAASVTKDEIYGRRYQTNDGARVVQARRNGLTYSILRGYSDWADIKNSTQDVWREYIHRAGNVTVQRIAVRYINVLELPIGFADFDDYLAAGPRVPSGVPQSITGFLCHVVIPFPDHGAIGVVTQALETPTQTHIPVVLDIDVHKQVALNGNSLEIWSELDSLREVKNSLFFSFVTKKCLEAYR